MQDTGTHVKHIDIWCVIPVHNNRATIKDVASKCLGYVENVLVIDDGSTDANLSDLMKDTNVTVLTHEHNMGKGAAILTALEYVEKQGGTHMITIDGDGQHLPKDLVQFIAAIEKHKNSIIVGCRNFNKETIPGSSKFGRSFSNMWVKIETGLTLNDTQSGFRSYPVKYLSQLRLHGHRYDFEIEVLARASWGGLEIRDIDIEVEYREDRVSSFHPFKSNFRISMMHARLVGRRLMPWPHRQLLHHKSESVMHQLKNPSLFIQRLMKENATPGGLAASAGVGTILAVVPIVGFHTIAIIYVTARLHLNKILAVTIQNIYAPPFAPFLCIELGHYMRYGKWWTDFSWSSITIHLHQRLWEWLLGSLILAPFFAIIASGIVYAISSSILKNREIQKEDEVNKAGIKKRGNALSFWFFKMALSVFGLRGAYGLLYPVCFYYLIFDRSAVRNAMAYIRRAYPGRGFLALHHHVFMLFVSQGKQLIDRSAALSGHVDFDFNVVGADDARELVKSANNGLILLTSHMGNWQLAVSILESSGKDVYLVMLPEHNEALKDVLRIRKDNDHIKIISPEAHLGGILEIMNVLRDGHIVSIMGDRAYGFESLEVDFLGDKAMFPYGAFKIAVAAKCPILFLSSTKTSTRGYDVDISKSIKPEYKDRKNRKKELIGWIQDYADMLAEYIEKNPRQCFLFHDIWRSKR